MKKVEGTFASRQLPLQIRFWVQDNQLKSQASGQSAFHLTPYSETEFRFDPAGIVIKFDADENDGKLNRFMLNQGGGEFGYERK